MVCMWVDIHPGEQVNELMDWRRKDQAEMKALLNFFVLVSMGREGAVCCQLLKRCT